MSKFSRHHTAAAKLTPGQVQQIRQLYDGGGMSQGSLAREFKIGVNQIGRICRREVWTEVPEMINADTIAASLHRVQQTLATEASVDAGIERMEELIRAQKAELTPGETKGDQMLDELSGAAAERLRKFKGE